MGETIRNEIRPCPMCGNTLWIRLEGMSTLQALEGGLQARRSGRSPVRL